MPNTDEEVALFNEIVTEAVDAPAPEPEVKVEAAAPAAEVAPEPKVEAKTEAKPEAAPAPDLTAILAQVAAMEARLAAKPEPPKGPVFDPNELLSDPLSYFERHGISPDVVARQMVLANAQRTGQAVTPELQAYHYADGAKRAVLTEVTAVKADLESVKAGLAKERFDLGVQRAAIDLTQYPSLATANKTDSAAFNELLAEEASRLYESGIKDPKQVLTQMEKQFARLQRVLAPPASAPTGSEGAKVTQSSPKATSASLRGAPSTLKAEADLSPEEFRAQFLREHNLQ